MNTKQNIQKTLYSIDQLQQAICQLKFRNEQPPCISLSGLRNLCLSQMVKKGDFKNIIQTLFHLLSIPAEYILEIKTAPSLTTDKHKIPFEVYIYLTDNNVKLKVYKLLLNHLKLTKQNKIHLKIVNHYLS